MSVKIRRALFISLTTIFIIAGVVLVLYSRGARFDFKSWEIVQTGGIYLKTEPTDVRIELDGESIENKSGFLQSGTLINNLEPGIYKVSVQAENYHSWEKEIRVESSTVAVFEGIILFPTQERELVASPTDKFYLEFSGGIVSQAERARLTSLFNQLKESQLRLPGPVPINKILPYPYNERKFIVMTDRALYSLDTERQVVSQISSRAKDFTLSGNDVFWFEDRGFFTFNLILRNQSRVNLPPELRVAEWKEIQVSPSGEIIAVLKNDGELIIWNRSINKVTSFDKNTSHFVFSPNSNKITFITQGNLLNVYGIKDGAQKEKFILENTSGRWSKIEEIVWHEDNNYLFLKDEESKLYFVEINDYPPVNVVEIASQIKSFIYSKDDDSLYYETPTGLWRVKL